RMTLANPDLLPVEFKKLGYQPSQWKPEDVVRIRHHGLTLNAKNELDRAQVFCKVKDDPVKADWLRRELSPTIDPALVDGLDPCAIPVQKIKDAYDQATATPKLTKLPPASDGAKPTATPPAQQSAGASPAAPAGLPVAALYNVVDNDS